MSKILAVSAVAAFLSAPAVVFAAVPLGVTAALDAALVDASAVAALALIIVVAIAAFKYMRRAL